ncbi:MAG TPA: TetR/AcrR family transcriptional regulator [Pyrinomonadaceae bacterium]|nr:TetR/AcrR family transcriptional regulator [Chloracidobacterium sp.]MBP9935030.1 TetR/AcrR family transcriptional regulator [Pyrinomonadaceae bacterium]MBK7801343.1 TetR/AcrR family transcriptional regulator [Chloracidobacterium sp.]MBK9436665.1 TetR/AcrR family transcriptional regulator [Chloracidobacterium sp.]MBK9766282.1 TetR/AcrR family transcriptional regulator [Chloracidobacterium sp.]
MSRTNRSGQSAKTVVIDKREAILRAATKVFAVKGYFNSKVSDIAGEAGIADGTVYLYFKSKEEVLHSIFDRAMSEFIEEGKREISGIASPEQRIRKIAQLHLEKLGSDRDMAIVFQVELRGSTKFMQEFSAAGFSDYLDIIRQTIEDGQQAGTLRSDIKPIICAKILYGALDEMVTNWILSKRSYPLTPMADEVLKIFFGGVMSG